LGVSQVNEDTDDVTNGIADYYKVVYEITTVPTSITINAADTYQITPTITRNDVAIDEALSYVSSGSVATVSGSGLITAVSSGSCVITVSMTANPSVTAGVDVVVAGSAVTFDEVRVSPTPDYILQEETETYSVYLYLNGSLQGDTFTFVIGDTNVPTENYVFTSIDGNSFSVKNEYMYLSYPLVISCVSGSYSRNLSIDLRGSW